MPDTSLVVVSGNNDRKVEIVKPTVSDEALRQAMALVQQAGMKVVSASAAKPPQNRLSLDPSIRRSTFFSEMDPLDGDPVEAFKRSALNFNVEMLGVSTVHGNVRDYRMVGKFSDSGDFLTHFAPCSPDRVLLNPHKFLDLAIELCNVIPGARIAGCFTPDGGRKCSIQIDLGDIQIGKDVSATKRFLTLLWSYDGTVAPQCGVSTVRIVCANTYAAARREMGKDENTLYHKSTKGLELAVKDWVPAVEANIKALDAHILTLEKLQAVSMGSQKYMDFVRELPAMKRDSAQVEMLRLFQSGTGIEGGIQNTAYAAWQAVTEYADHRSQIKENANTAENALYGAAARFKAVAWDKLSALAA